MSVVKRKVQEVVVIKDGEVVICDGPGCEAEYGYDQNTHVPEGWRVLLTQTGVRDYHLNHFHSTQCLVNWVDETWPAGAPERAKLDELVAD